MKIRTLVGAVAFMGFVGTANAEPIKLNEVQLDRTVAAGSGSGSDSKTTCCTRTSYKYVSSSLIGVLNNSLNENNVSILSGNQLLSGIGILGSGTAVNSLTQK